MPWQKRFCAKNLEFEVEAPRELGALQGKVLLVAEMVMQGLVDSGPVCNFLHAGAAQANVKELLRSCNPKTTAG